MNKFKASYMHLSRKKSLVWSTICHRNSVGVKFLRRIYGHFSSDTVHSLKHGSELGLIVEEGEKITKARRSWIVSRGRGTSAIVVWLGLFLGFVLSPPRFVTRLVSTPSLFLKSRFIAFYYRNINSKLGMHRELRMTCNIHDKVNGDRLIN